MNGLLKKYPVFTPDFVINILGLDMDSLLIPGNSQDSAVRLFIHDYRFLKDSSDVLYNSFNNEADDIKNALQFSLRLFPVSMARHLFFCGGLHRLQPILQSSGTPFP